jgi:hypothetical protein
MTSSNNIFRAHLLKEIGVISLRGVRSGVDEKVVELAKLFQLCGCDFFALRKYFDDLQINSSGSPGARSRPPSSQIPGVVYEESDLLPSSRSE